MDKFPQRLKELRKMYKVTQKQIALMTKITERVYQSYEYGKVIPTATALISLSDFFYVSIDYLVGRNDNPQHEYYLQKKEDTLLLDMPSNFVTLFKYAKTKGFKNESLSYQETVHLITMFKEWKEFSRQLTIYFEKEYSYKKKYIYEQKNNSSFKKWFYFFIGEVLQGTNKNPICSTEYKNFDNIERDRKFEMNLRMLMNFNMYNSQDIENDNWRLAPLPDRLIDYLYPITEDDMKHPERRK
ncbi:MAG: helix-turn-helix transcriptional regulator [Smithella sp.]